MNILADENIPRLIVDCLRDQGHDVYWVAESNPAIKDQQVLELAIHSERLLITFDKDFGSLVFKEKLPSKGGIVLIRFPLDFPEEEAKKICSIISSRTDWAGYYSVIDEKRIRMISLQNNK